MDVIIRGVSPKVYREFKARAAKLGLRLRDALGQAMGSWAGGGSVSTAALADVDNQAYQRMKPELLKKFRGKHVAIAKGEVVAVADSVEDLGAKMRKLSITRALGLHVGREERSEVGEWLWGSIAPENVRATKRE